MTVHGEHFLLGTQKTLDLGLAEGIGFGRQNADSTGLQFQMFL